jgi:hypothetical protein
MKSAVIAKPQAEAISEKNIQISSRDCFAEDRLAMTRNLCVPFRQPLCEAAQDGVCFLILAAGLQGG